jgi:hypothetical protein
MISKLRRRAYTLEQALRRARMFIEYARYELKDGTADVGEQFPHKNDATTAIQEIDLALANHD